MSKKEKKQKRNLLADQSQYEEYKNSIPEDEIWTYKIDGLQEPHISKTFDNARTKKIIVVITLVIAIGIAMFFSVRVVHNETFKYQELPDGTYELVKFSNPGDITEITVDFVDNDPDKPISVIHEYAFNCDEKITKISIGKDVREIAGNSIYSCYSLKEIDVDPQNEAYMSDDGVLYDKAQTVLITYPIDRDLYLREKSGYDKQYWPEDPEYDEAYLEKVNTYKVPATVKTIGMLAFNYSELFRIYLPEGLETIETMAFFRNWHIEDYYTYDGDTVYPSLPESLKTIGSDAFNSNQQVNYMFIPASVTEIGHHAFWNAAYKEDGELRGISVVNVAVSEEDFNANVVTGDLWTGQYDKGAFPHSIPVNYSAVRLSLDEYEGNG